MSDDSRAREVEQLGDCDDALSRHYDLAILDLDGVVYHGEVPVPGAVEALETARHRGMHLAYVTNNASQPPEVVVERLRTMDVPVADGDVVTSAQAAARVVAEAVRPGARVLVVGDEGLISAVCERGLSVTNSAHGSPEAVVQGFSPTVDWAQLAEATYAVAAGSVWVASNTDPTLPTSRGMAPGNGAFVAAVAGATGASPVVAGKPEPPLLEETLQRVGGRSPIVVGDRLETDIAAANSVGVDSLLVLTGVSGLDDLAHAPPASRPTYVGADLGALHQPQPVVEEDGWTRVCEGMAVREDARRLVPERTGPSASGEATALVRAAVALAWSLQSCGALDLTEVHRQLASLVR